MSLKISQFAEQNSGLVNAAFLIGFVTILGAWAFELIGGYQPCELCLFQRIPYYAGLPIIALALASWNKIHPIARLMMVLLAAGIFLWSAYLGTNHAGIEWKLWAGSSACAGTGASISFSDLNAAGMAPVIPCDEPQFRFLGISFAGYNALISALIVFLLSMAVFGQFREMQGIKK